MHHGIEYVYTVDAEDIIRSINQAWSTFAQENDTPDLPRRVLGSPLQDHIQGDMVQQTYATLYDKVRRTQQPVQVPFRCDAPWVRRDMQLTIEPLPDGGLRFISVLLAQRGYEQPILLLDPTSPHNGDLIRMCAWCKDIHVRDEGWIELEQAIQLLRLFQTPHFPRVTHGICEDCLTIALEA